MIKITDTLSLPDEAAEPYSKMVNSVFATIVSNTPNGANFSPEDIEQLHRGLKVAAGTYILSVAEASEKFQGRAVA